MKLLWAVEEELPVYKDTVSCEHLVKLLSMLPAKEENLLNKLEEEIQMDRLEATL